MKTAIKKMIYVPTLGEEVANSISHGVMAILVLLALPFSAVWAYIHEPLHPILASVGVSVFVLSIFLMLLCSTLYHTMQPESKHKAVFHILDHIMIYFAIAGSYTPVALCVIGGWQGALIVVVQWLMVLFGIFYKSLAKRSIPSISLTIYLIMGWMIIIFFPLFWKSASTPLLALIAAGGIFYTIGAWFYAKKGFKYHHLVWHLLINLALICHFIGIVFFLY
ncbi:MAG: hemolysin III family protein [Alistipes sp.]|nr:hemolysin III family protein [Alistipes sp.]